MQHREITHGKIHNGTKSQNQGTFILGFLTNSSFPHKENIIDMSMSENHHRISWFVCWFDVLGNMAKWLATMWKTMYSSFTDELWTEIKFCWTRAKNIKFFNSLTMSWYRKLKIKRFAPLPIQHEIGTEIACEISPATLKLFGSNSDWLMKISNSVLHWLWLTKLISNWRALSISRIIGIGD